MHNRIVTLTYISAGDWPKMDPISISEPLTAPNETGVTIILLRRNRAVILAERQDINYRNCGERTLLLKNSPQPRRQVKFDFDLNQDNARIQKISGNMYKK